MVYFFKKSFLFIKRNPRILYSFSLLIIIPLSLYYITSLTLDFFQKNIDLSLQSKALLAEDILNSFISESISQGKDIQEKIDQIAEDNPEIDTIQIIFPKEKDFEIVYSNHSQEKGKKITEESIPLSWFKNQSIAHLFVAQNGERFWQVVKPLYDSEGKKIALISMKMSLREADLQAVKIIKKVYLVGIGVILLVLFLILHHTQLFRYVILFKDLKKESQEKDDFVNMAMHELKAPIINTRNYILVLQEEMKGYLNKEQEEYLSRALTSVERLNDLTSDMNEVISLQQRKLSFKPQKISLYDLIKEVVEIFKPEAQKKNIELIFKEKKERVFININPNRLKEVLENLISNAIKYTFRGKVEITTEISSQQKYLIIIEDTGIGISAQDQKRLGEKFYRVKTKETEEISGTGLGLWIADQIVKNMGGKILLESIKGRGSKFIVELPLMED